MFILWKTCFSYFLPLLVLLLFLHKCFSSGHKPIKNPPSSPWKLPIIGNLHQLGSHPHRSLYALAKKHGPLMLLRLCSVPLLVVSSADAAREILKTHDLIFSNRPKTTFSRKVTYDGKDIAFAPYGEYWRQVKSIAVIHLLSSKSVQSFQRIREEETALMIDEISDTISSSSSLVNLSDLFISLTNDVVCRSALGRKHGGAKFKGLLTELVEILGVFCVGDYIPWLSWMDHVRGLYAKADRIVKKTDAFLEGVVQEHLDRNKIEVDEGQGKDLVDILLEVQRENRMEFLIDRNAIKALILDMFTAGSDTTFTALEWAMAELLRHPYAMKKLQHEVREMGRGKSKITEDDIESLQYLKAVVKEALRLHPPTPLLVPRESTKEVRIMGCDIAAGTQVFVNAWAIGRDPCSWEDPEEFKPERFLDSPVEFKGLHYELIPFGAGRRGCPGINFATRIIELALANVVHKFDLAMPGVGRAEDLDMSEACGMSVHKKFPLIVEVIAASVCSY